MIKQNNGIVNDDDGNDDKAVAAAVVLVYDGSLDELFNWSGDWLFDCSGNVIIETRFFDGDLLVSISKVRVFYV